MTFKFLQQISGLHRLGKLRELLVGVHQAPVVEAERIFMVLEIKSATTIADALGNLGFSRFMQEFFADLTSALLLTKAEVYQYVGNTLILTWSLEVGLHHARCVRCFLLIQQKTEDRRLAYLQEYGYYPQVRAGLHVGLIVAAWVGGLKQKTIYHGDALSVTARIQGLCQELDQELLTSRDLLEQLPPTVGLQADYVHTLYLRGRQQQMSLYGLHMLLPSIQPSTMTLQSIY